MKRVVIPELLDTDSGTPSEIEDALADLRTINQKFGGVGTMRSMVDRVSSRTGMTSFTVLEVAAGTGYVPDTVNRQLASRGIHLEITLLDRAISHLPSISGSPVTKVRNAAVVGDALSLPFQNASFDLVDCSLFAHHLSPDEIVRFVQEGLRVCRVGVLINDIVRHRLHHCVVYAALPLFRSRITRHDAVVSIRRSYTLSEMTDLLKRTAAVKVEIKRHYLFRMGVIAWKSRAAEI